MKVRYNMVRSFIDENVKEGNCVADIGAGSGIFSIMMAENGADVFFPDYVGKRLT